MLLGMIWYWYLCPYDLRSRILYDVHLATGEYRGGRKGRLVGWDEKGLRK